MKGNYGLIILTMRGRDTLIMIRSNSLKLMIPLVDYITKNMNQNLMKGFKLLVIQFGSKLGAIGDNSGLHLEEKKTMGEHIFSRTGPHNRPHEFQSTPRPTAPKFIVPK